MINSKKVQKLINQINKYKSLNYNVIETFQKSGTITYQLNSLSAERENGVLLIIDEDEKVYEYGCGIMTTMISSIKNIEFIDDSIILHLESDKIGQATIIIEQLK